MGNSKLEPWQEPIVAALATVIGGRPYVLVVINAVAPMPGEALRVSDPEIWYRTNLTGESGSRVLHRIAEKMREFGTTQSFDN